MISLYLHQHRGKAVCEHGEKVDTCVPGRVLIGD